jgi:hypothetical protein
MPGATNQSKGIAFFRIWKNAPVPLKNGISLRNSPLFLRRAGNKLKKDAIFPVFAA